MQLKSLILLFAYFIIIAKSYKVIWIDTYDAGTMKKKKTSDGKYDVKHYWHNKYHSCWETCHSVYDCYGCCLKEGKIINGYWKVEERGQFKNCIDVKKGTIFTDVKMRNVSGLKRVFTNDICEKQTHKLKQDIYKVFAYCINTGCLTQYGWVNSGNYKIRNC